ncbi:NAD(P)H-binding protein [Sphingomonas sp. R-74633]|uniref:SDR family oxidoreductase n=1 Tax=Sphingomonas sp. R-74633 TaxID=2751188 RepID=UPI0015D1C201|nr:NAD-dependent epimerase/dehydratase family protein [Sphingomonas sp. R-74633]NYT41455.1 NAD(P)H-binding protein [Sphingomonas sp. R-74633]
MRIVVVGGTGRVGAKLVRQLEAAGHDIVAAARSTGVDIVTGAGLDRALEGAEVVIDVSNPGYADPDAMLRFFEAAGATLLAAERVAGIAHHVTFSAIGAERIGAENDPPCHIRDGDLVMPASIREMHDDASARHARRSAGYYRAKNAQEALVTGAGIPFTIVRSTPLFEYIHDILYAGRTRDEVRVPPVRVQPIAADDAARVLMEVALRDPANAVVELAGPNIYALPDLATQMLTGDEDYRPVVVDADALFFGARLGAEALVAGAGHRLPEIQSERT